MIAEDIANCGFACPQVGLDQSFLEVLVVDHARLISQMFIERYNSYLEQYSSGLVPILTSWLPHDETFGTVWDLAFGEVYTALFPNRADDVDRRAGVLGLRLHECGYAGEWELYLGRPARFRFDRWLLPLADAIQVSATTDTVSIRARSATVWHNTAFQRSKNGWGTSDTRSLPTLIRPGTRWIVLTAEALQTREFASVWGDIDMRTPEVLVSRCDAALSLIADYAGIYLPWVNRVLRYLVPLQAKPGFLESGSDGHTPGVIRISNDSHRSAMAEMLVHEATHQYFYILKRLGAIDNGSDPTLYFSPFRNKGRPIYFIVLAYHAFGNVLLFYRTAHTHGLSADEYIINHEQQLAQQLEVLERALQTTTALTPLGRALWEPLYEQIHS